MIGKVLFWGSLGALGWTHAGYPLAAAALARLRPRPVRKRDFDPSVSVIVAAHNEEDVIAKRVENLLAQDYPPERLEVVVASDGSTDTTDQIVAGLAEENPRVRLLQCPRAGKVATQNRAFRATKSEVVAFSDANARWDPNALALLVRNFADPDVAYVCGGHRYDSADGTNRESTYWRYESWVRRSESALGSITGGIGPIYAVRRTDYVENEPRFGHDLGFPYLMAQRGRRAVYEPAAIATERPSRDLEDEYRRKVRMLAQCWLHVLSGRILRGGGALYLTQIVSHRLLRYSTGALHVVLFTTSVTNARHGGVYRIALAGQGAWLVLAAAGRLRLRVPGAALAYYYLLVTLATLSGLVRYLRSGAPVVWEKVEGTR
ncbi:MAG TPA: glycosyltransferase family 2 protein [Gaiellaceae bacterium]|jgi:glycosyltransferase involved in cell wall biosynthesis|nr:glycosyltransferase family 2 protein [Gaiellaceae bacterium]